MMFLLLTVLVASAIARPDVSHLSGYNYKPPSTSYGTPAGQPALPSGSYLPTGPGTVQQLPGPGNAGSFQTGFSSSGIQGGGLSGLGGLTSSGGFDSLSLGSGSLGAGSLGTGSLGTGFGSGSLGSFESGSLGVGSLGSGSLGSGSLGSGFSSGFGTSSSFGSGSNGLGGASGFGSLGGQSVYQQQQQQQQYTQVEDRKHVYFYAAPEEQQTHRLRISYAPSVQQRNTNIVFIKAPAPDTVVPEIIAPAPQQPQKTLVYVLTKKQEAPAPITLPAPQAAPATKPEVFFIKYKTPQDAEQAIHSNANGENINAANAHETDGQTVLRTIQHEDANAHQGGFSGQLTGGSLGSDVSSSGALISGGAAPGFTGFSGNVGLGDSGAGLTVVGNGLPTGGSSLEVSHGGSSGSLEGVSPTYGPPGVSGPY